MGQIKNEGGYTLIIVLLVITLLLAFSAVFMATSMNHSTQEKTVETGNQAIAAAEMGVEYTVFFTKDALQEVYESVVVSSEEKSNRIKDEARKYPGHNTVYPACDSKKVIQEWVDCNYMELEKDQKTEFAGKVRSLVEEVNAGRKSLVLNQPEEVEENTDFNISSYDLDEGAISFKVRGETNNLERNLTGRIEIPNPVILNNDRKDEITITQVTPPKDLIQFFPQLKKEELPVCPKVPTKGMSACEYNNLLTSDYLSKVSKAGVGPDFYIKVNQIDKQLNNFNGYGIPLYIKDGLIETEPNLNNSSNITMYYEGLLAIKNLNNSSNHFMMAERITFQNNQNLYDSTFILVGNSNKPEFSPSKLTINSGSRLCLNKDHLRISSSLLTLSNLKDSKSNLNYVGSGMIYIFTSQKPLPSGNSHVKYFGNTLDFLESCGVKISSGDSSSQTVRTPIFFPDLNADYDIEVNY